MGDSVSLGDLFVRISGNVDGLDAAAKKGIAALGELNAGGNRLVSGMTTTTAAVTGVVLLMAKAIDSAINGTVAKFIEMGKTAQQIGLPVEELNKLQFAAKKAGVTTDELTQGIRLFARNAGEVRSSIEPLDQFSLSMRAIGISFETVKNANPTQLLLEVADRFSRMEDGLRKTRIAMDLFGRSGADMIPFLNRGSAAIQEYMDQLQASGNVIDKGVTEKALKFQLAMGSLNNTFEIIVRRLVADFLPILESIATTLNGAAKSADNMKMATEGLRVVFLGLVNVATLAAAAFKATLEGIGGTVQTIVKLMKGDFSGALEAYKNAWKTGFTTIVDGVKEVGSQWVNSGILAGGWATTVTKAADTVAKDLKVVEQTAKQAAEAHALQRRNLIESLTLTPGPTVFAIQAIEQALRTGKISLDEYTQAMDKALGNERQFQLLQLDEVMERTTSSMKEKVGALEEAWRKGAIGQAQYGRTMRSIEQQNREQMLETASMAASTISAVFKNNKGASIAAALINTAVAITKALAQGGMWAWPQAALIAAAGAAQVAAISSTSEDGSGGGSPSVNGQATQQAAVAPVATEERTMFVQGFNKNEFFDGETTRQIVSNIVQYQRDGGKVVLT